MHACMCVFVYVLETQRGLTIAACIHRLGGEANFYENTAYPFALNLEPGSSILIYSQGHSKHYSQGSP